MNHSNIPGASQIIEFERPHDGRSFYCMAHRTYVNPLFVRVDDTTYATCEDCFLNDIKAQSATDLGDAVEVIEVAKGDVVEEDDIISEIDPSAYPAYQTTEEEKAELEEMWEGIRHVS